MFVIWSPKLQASNAFAVLYSAPTITTGVGVGVCEGVGVITPEHALTGVTKLVPRVWESKLQ